MRIRDIDPKQLCRKHLFGEHREIHGLWSILIKHKGVGGYARHPETLRWIGKQGTSNHRHDLLVNEMISRGYQHQSPLIGKIAKDEGKQSIFINNINEQKELLNNKPCECLL
ncbi:MAG: pyrimidine dimer DNA glycosylase/endonuclease V [Bacteroidetes bacterium]|nr:pyrimidine dimer DNA glycosylase/endonuclease V [Bacteroidota bacterium]